MTPTPLTAKEKLEHIAECPDGCGVCKSMANDVRARMAELEAAIIERCAQVAEQKYARIGGEGFHYGAEIAAAIRALKDKP